MNARRALLLAGLILLGGVSRGGGQEPGVLTSAREVRGLTAAQIAQSPPVRIRGVVTFHEPETGITFLQDGEAGLAILAGVPSRLPAEVQAGRRVEVEGVAVRGSYAPVVNGRDGAPPRLTVLGSGDLPEPLGVGIEELLGGANDGRWVEMKGVVRSVAVRPFAPDGESGRAGSDLPRPPASSLRLSLELGTLAGRFVVIIPWRDGEAPPVSLVDARVRVRGVLGPIVNRNRQWVGLLIYVPSLAQLVVERLPAADPFQLPERRVDEIMQFSTGSPGEDRVHVRGVVTLAQSGYRIFVRSPAGPLEVQTPWPLEGVRPGVEVAVVGYPTMGAKRVLLQDSRLKVLASLPPPEPLELSRSEIMARYADSELVRTHGRLFQNALRGSNRVLVVEAEGQLMEVKFANSLGAAEDTRVALLRPGAELAVTGIAQVAGASDWGGGVRPYAVSLLLRSPADLVVLREPPWWTPARFLVVLGALALLLFVVVGWVVALRRRVAAQTRVIREQALREVNERERRRIAQDIHDDLGSRLTQLALLGARVKAAAKGDGPTAELGERISATARTTVQTMDEIVWAVNPGNDTLQSLGDYLCKVATALLAGAEIACQLEVPAVLPALRLSADQRHNLVLAVREALHNVVKHSRASAATLSLRLEGAELVIEIGDNGGGIPGQGAGRGNGLGNLRRRLSEVGGTCEIGPGATGGTRVRLAAPLRHP